MSKLRRLVGILFLISSMIVSQIPSINVSANNSSNEFVMDGNTLVKYNGSATSITIPDSVMNIGIEAFADNSLISAVLLSDNTKSIGVGAFRGCRYLTTVGNTKNVKTIGNAAFADCPSLNNFHIGDNVVTLGSGVFAGCTSLDTFTVSQDNLHFILEDNALYNIDKTMLYAYLANSSTSIYDMPSSVSSISPYTFWGNHNLTGVILSTSLRSIPAYSFSNCKNLNSINIPASVNRIDMKSFENCSNLKSVDIPYSVGYIHPTAFDGCVRLNINAPEGSMAYEYSKNIDNSEPTTVEKEETGPTRIYSDSNTLQTEETDNAHENNPNDDNSHITSSDINKPREDFNITDPSNVDYMPPSNVLDARNDSSIIGQSMVVGGNAFVFIDDRQDMVRSGDDKINIPSTTDNLSVIDNIFNKDDVKGVNLPKYSYINNQIADYAYYGNSDMNEYSIENGTVRIGDFAFARTRLNNISLPEGLTDIGYGAFYHCDSLGNISIPKSVENIEPYALDNTSWLEEWKSSNDINNYLIVGDNILVGYKGNESVVDIPEGIKKIYSNVFAGHAEINSISLPSTLVELGEYAFKGCSSLTDISGGNNVRVVQAGAFYDCPLKGIRIKESIESIGLNAYNSENGVVLFDGNSLPNISYEKSTSRLSSLNRELVLDNVRVAIITNNINESDFTGTILDPNLLGFRGLICSIISEPNASDNGKVEARYISTGNVNDSNIPNSIEVFDKIYDVVDIEDVKNISVVDPIIDNNTSAVIDVRISNSNANISSLDIKASLKNALGNYILYMEMDNNPNREIIDGYFRVYGDTAPKMYCFNMELFTPTGVPIKRLGNDILSVIIPIPKGLTGNTIHVVTTDANGQLEEIMTDIIEQDGIQCIELHTNHLSQYAIYAYGELMNAEEGSDNIKYLSHTRVKDSTPDTGDNMPSPKWFIVAGLFFIGLTLLFVKRRKHHHY